MADNDEDSEGQNYKEDFNGFREMRNRRPALDLEVLEDIEDNPRVAQEDEENAFTLTIDLAFSSNLN